MLLDGGVCNAKDQVPKEGQFWGVLWAGAERLSGLKHGLRNLSGVLGSGIFSVGFLSGMQVGGKSWKLILSYWDGKV